MSPRQTRAPINPWASATTANQSSKRRRKSNTDSSTIYLLDACHKILVADDVNHNPIKPPNSSVSPVSSVFKQGGFPMDPTTHSVTDLKAKGVRFIPSSACTIKDIRFKSGAFKAEHRLPVRMVWSNSLIIVANMIAYEVSPGSDSEFEVLSYTNFIKSLIESPEDAKELQEKGIIINRFQNNEQLVEKRGHVWDR